MAFDSFALPCLESPLPLKAAKEGAQILVRERLALARRPRRAKPRSPNVCSQRSSPPFMPPTIAAIWQAVFGIEQIGIHDNFSDLGGDSLVATQLVSRLRKQFSQEISLRTFFDHATIDKLAQQWGLGFT
jgi:acyl carrier protein